MLELKFIPRIPKCMLLALRGSLLPLPALFLTARPARMSNQPCASSASDAARRPLIEVERKFRLAPEDIATLGERVASVGGEVRGEKRFTDVYWDTAECALTRRDTWLRCRDGAWELKVPLAGQAAKRSGGERTTFEEIEGEAPVASSLRSLLSVEGGGGGVSAVLEAARASPFAEFETVRTQWQIGSCSIDADVASFGHAVLEIEVMCADASEVGDAEAEIGRVAELIGARPLGALGGKLETYIRTRAPAVLAHLVDAGVLQASPDEATS